MMNCFLKVLSTSTIVMLLILNCNAQSNWEAGIRYGDESALDATIPLSAKPRLHGAIYLGNNEGKGFGLGGYFDWMFSLSDGSQGLKFYPGVGPDLYFGDSFNISVTGDFGVEYSFNFPITVGFDWRPALFLTNDIGYIGENWGFIARFRIGEGTKFKKE